METFDIDASTGLIDTIPREREGVCANYDDSIRYISRRLREGMTYEKWRKMYVIGIQKTCYGNALRPWQFSVNVVLNGIGPYRTDNRSVVVGPMVINCWSYKKIIEGLDRFIESLNRYIVYKDEAVEFKVVRDLVDDIKRKIVVTYQYDDKEEYTI